MTMTRAQRNNAEIRVLAMSDQAAVARELARMGCDSATVLSLAPKGVIRLVRLERVPSGMAQILRQEMIVVGGDAAIDATGCGVLLLGTEAQLTDFCTRHHTGKTDLSVMAAVISQTLTQLTTTGRVLRCGAYHLPLGEKTYLMGILNMTPDSFSGDGLIGDIATAVRQAEAMLADGADLLDVGGESTRPGATAVTLEEEMARVIPVIAALAPLGVPISVDTYKSVVAAAALDAGATLVNDISGLRFDPEMARVVADAGVPVVVMHIRGTPRTMQQHPVYDDLLTEVCAYLRESTAIAEDAGIPHDQVVLDPGFGFGKTVEHNLELLRRLLELRSTGQPVLLGVSRKSSIGHILHDLPPAERVEGTGAAVAIGIMHGADIVRIHDVRAMCRVAQMTDAVVRGWAPPQ